MALFSYVGGLEWAYYDNSGDMGDITACKFAAFGLEVVYATEGLTHILIFETLTGTLKRAWKP